MQEIGRSAPAGLKTLRIWTASLISTLPLSHWVKQAVNRSGVYQNTQASLRVLADDAETSAEPVIQDDGSDSRFDIVRKSLFNKGRSNFLRMRLTLKQRGELFAALKARFEANANRHEGITWAKVQAALDDKTEKLGPLFEMERTGGEPDVVGWNAGTSQYVFVDCSPESPKGRVSLCYDREALDSRKEHKPRTSVLDLAAEMGVELLSEQEYFQLQKLGEFDSKTSSWIATPGEIRKLGGALYGDRRYGRVFVGHNGAQSYYSSRGFRGSLKV